MLPMSPAILTVLWPEEFTVYDVRACRQLGDFHKLGDHSREDRILGGLLQYRAAVEAAVAEPLSLRDNDRVLWARSAVRELESDIRNSFVRWSTHTLSRRRRATYADVSNLI